MQDSNTCKVLWASSLGPRTLTGETLPLRACVVGAGSPSMQQGAWQRPGEQTAPVLQNTLDPPYD